MSGFGIQWAGFRSLTYEIPVSTEYDGFVNLQSLARRIARAIVHFMTVIRLAAHCFRHTNLRFVLVKSRCAFLGPRGATSS